MYVLGFTDATTVQRLCSIKQVVRMFMNDELRGTWGAVDKLGVP